MWLIVMIKFAVIRFRGCLAFYESKLARSLSSVGRKARSLIWAAVINPGRIIQKVLGKLHPKNRIEIGEVPKRRKKITFSSKPSLPIIFVHQSNSEYLKYTFAQARISNPDSPLFLLGDSTNAGHEGVEHQSMFDYFRQAAEFRKVYKHFSTNGLDYELINFQRWFILKEFLIANHIKRCLYLDSDTLVYTNVTEDSKKFEYFDFTLSQMTSGCTFFLNRIEALSEFCAFLFDVYSGKDKYHYDKLVAHFTARKMNRLPGGVCDMTAFQLYHELHFGEIGEAAQVIDGSVYDPAITSPAPGIEMANGIKKIMWREGVPYGKHFRTGHEIKFNSLQFQGSSKYLMSEYCTAGIQDASWQPKQEFAIGN